MIIEPKSQHAVFVTINGWVYYIDDSTGEQIMQKYRENCDLTDDCQEIGDE